jgi:hypothetical protein
VRDAIALLNIKPLDSAIREEIPRNGQRCSVKFPQDAGSGGSILSKATVDDFRQPSHWQRMRKEVVMAAFFTQNNMLTAPQSRCADC